MSKSGIFTSPEGKSYAVTFTLVSSLFLLWGFCNGMIDVMDKHFQQELHLTLAQSAWVQFAHYLGYFLMAMPAGWLASKLGYKGGIIAGLLMVAVGGFWFIPATKIATFPAFLLGVCIIASGLTFLETVANPYTTVLGPKQFAATRINLAQSCNGVGWIFGPIVGAQFFYGKNAAGESTGSETLWIPYAAIGGFVLILAVVFSFCKMPDVASEDEFHVDDKTPAATAAPAANRGIAMGLLWLNIVVLAVAVGMIFSAIVAIPSVGAKLGMTENQALWYASGILAAIGTMVFFLKNGKITNHSIWSHPHFSGATLTQFFYVAAQCGIFAYFINYMTSQIPPVSESLKTGAFASWFEVHKNGVFGLSDKGASNLASVGFVCFLIGRVIGAALLKKFPAHKVLAAFATLAGICSLLVYLKLGWLSAIALFLTYLFMSIMFPTIFSLGIYGLGSRAKNAASFIVMAIMGGAIMPKLMGHIADNDGMSAGFIVPLICFIWVAAYGFTWSKLSGSTGLIGVSAKGGH
ncbi:MAG: MFS transporter [Verrucomicrobia bacterium]|nr:MAG: MFS transporter [Verrucomicrobiota bacterium]TAE88426.1 MAG: MFS transporter [Verrucomicrobiota bacterium]TAF26879.1 MAG: MFS transporter [Verrucomicrobiota bacterium]TAF42137.1 MAG: MFS transporter [Verrucomicrobiota bacterium]